MCGGYDLLVIVEGETLQDVASFISEKLSTIKGVISTATHFRLKAYKENGVALTARGEDRAARGHAMSVPDVRFQDLELGLRRARQPRCLRGAAIRALRGNARLSALPTSVTSKSYILNFHESQKTHRGPCPRHPEIGHPRVLRHRRAARKKSSPSASASPTSTRRGTSARRRSTRSSKAARTTPRTSACPSCASSICRYVHKHFGIAYDPRTEVIITVGVSRGDRPRPARAAQSRRRSALPRAVLRQLRAERRSWRTASPVAMPTRAEDNFRLTAEALAAADHAALEGADAQLPLQPDRRHADAARSWRRSRASASSTISSC